MDPHVLPVTTSSRWSTNTSMPTTRRTATNTNTSSRRRDWRRSACRQQRTRTCTVTWDGCPTTCSRPYSGPVAFGIGMLHGIGAETPTQVLIFLAAAGVVASWPGSCCSSVSLSDCWHPTRWWRWPARCGRSCPGATSPALRHRVDRHRRREPRHRGAVPVRQRHRAASLLQRLGLVGEVLHGLEAEAALDAEVPLVTVWSRRCDLDDPVVLDVQVEIAAHAAVGADRAVTVWAPRPTRPRRAGRART